MRPDPKAAFFVGLLALLVFVGAGAAFAIDPGLFSRRVAWVARFPQTASLDEGAAVYAHGKVVGRVAGLDWVPASQDFAVRLRMDPDWRPPADGGLRVEEINPLRGAVIEAVDGRACEGRQPAAGPGTVPTCRRLPGMVEVTSLVLARVSDVVVQVEGLAHRVGEAGSGGGAAGPAEPSPFAAVADNLGALSGSARLLVDRLVTLEPALRETLLSARDASARADAALRRSETLLDGLQRDTVVRLNHTLDGADRLVRGSAPPLQSSAADIQYILGASSTSLVRLIAELDTAAGNLAELTRQLRDSPGVLLRGRSLENPPGAERAR